MESLATWNWTIKSAYTYSYYQDLTILLFLVWLKNGVSSNITGSLNFCGNGYSDPAYNLPIEITIPHTEKSVKVSFGSSLKTDPCSASYGIDDIILYVK